MVKKIFIFWIGKIDSISILLEKLDKQGFEVEVGPSQQDHIFLMKNFEYYRISYENKIWSFCSDVWRAYKLSKEKGMYIDTSVEIGDSFLQMYEKCMEADTTLIKENDISFATCVLASSIENNNLFESFLNIFNLPINGDLIRLYEVAPVLFTSFLWKSGIENNGFFEETFYEFNQKIWAIELLEIRNKNTIIKKGAGTWMKSIEHRDINMNNLPDTWNGAEEKWLLKKKNKSMKRSVDLINKYGYWVSMPQRIRDAYDASIDREERAKLSDVFKKIPFRTKISEKLLWSRLFVFFTFKWLKTK